MGEKAVYYARVSTEEESQANALLNQCEEAKRCITTNGWELVDHFIDEGKSGTTTEKRSEYNRLYEDMSNDSFDIIVIKSQDRLMRNVKDWYLFLDHLVKNHKKLFMYIENKYYTPDDALITGIKAIMAEDYSRELSKKINNAHRNRQRTGQSVSINNKTWGYDKIDKSVVINIEEAKLVKQMYELCVEGYGSRTISKILSNMGVKSRSGGEFAEVTVRKIIRNPLYRGCAIMNKYHWDFNTKKSIRNPKNEWIIHEEAVPPIVDVKLWEAANREMDKRATLERCKDRGELIRGYNKGKFNLSSKVICGECGKSFWRRKRKRRHIQEEVIEWMCSTYCSRGRKEKKRLVMQQIENRELGCDNIHLNEAEIFHVLQDIGDDFYGCDQDGIVQDVINMLRSVIDNDDHHKEKKQLETDYNKIVKQKQLLLDKLLEEVISDIDYKVRNTELETSLKSIEEAQVKLLEKVQENKNIETRLNDIRQLLYDSGIKEAGMNYMIGYIDKIVVFPEYLDIHLCFLSGSQNVNHDLKKVPVSSTKERLDCHK